MKTEFSRIPLLFLIAILLLVACNRNDDPPPDIIDPPPVAEIAEKSDSGAAPLNVPTEPVEEPELVEEAEVVNEEPEEVTMEPAGPTPGSTVQHTVQVGDWLVQIARCYGASYSAVRQANPQIANPHYIIPGRTVTVPNIGSVGEINGAPCVAEYTVAAGETWIGLAKRFGTTAVILRRVNPGRLWAGDKIIVPAHSAAVVVVDPPPPPPPPPEPEPSRIMFAAGETAVTIGANVVANGQTAYIFRANEGQQHKITLAPSQDDVTFTLVNASNPSQNLPTEGILPATGDYIIRVSGGAVDATFSLALSIVDTENGGGLNLVDATRINFAPGATSAAVTGNVAAGQMVAYVFTASQGQKLVIEFTPSDAAVTYLVTPPQLGNVIPENGILPLTGNYHLVITGGGVDATFSLMLSITNP